MANPSASGHRHLLLLTAALLLTCAGHALSAATQRCPSCGTTPVPWPLSTAAACGDQLYKLRCSGGALFFDTTNNTYPITSISPETQRLTIQPSPFLPNTCITEDLSSQGVQLSPSSPFNITSSNMILYFNCSESLLNSPVNCSSASLCHTYLNGSRAGGACGTEPICCSFQAGGSTTSYSIRVRESGCRAYRSFVNLDYSLPVSRWPQPGMELQWVSPREPVCGAQSDCDWDSTCRSDPNSNPGVRRCFCNSGFHWDAIAGSCARDVTCKDKLHGCSDSKVGLIAGLTTGLGAGLTMAVMGFFHYKRHQRIRAARERIARDREDILNSSGGKSAKLFTGGEMKKATNNFSRDRLLGVGGYGEVYKGILDDGTVVAIKCAKLGNSKGTDQVLNEVRILCQVNHKSLVGLLGCCVELEQPLMVYEYVSNGTLLEHLRGLGFRNSKKLAWSSRLQIARATADALSYLHFSALPPIYHRDVKSSNILLDEKLNAKVSDFGLSRLAETDMSHISTCAQGTLGYLDPEYYRNYQLTDKSDVYSFGVVLLELMTSQRAIDFSRPEDDVNLAVYVQRLVDEERIMDAVDPVLKEGASDLTVDTIKAFGFLAMGCLEPRRQDRPSMKEVVEEIEYIISIANSNSNSNSNSKAS